MTAAVPIERAGVEISQAKFQFFAKIMSVLFNAQLRDCHQNVKRGG
jgi:hypothetical protein